MSRKVMIAILAHREGMPLLSDDHFSADCTLVKVLAPSELERLNLEFSANLPWLGEELKTMKASRFTE